ncbi:MAG: hypothetical protein ABW321_01285 [Polyangiales bacterium]
MGALFVALLGLGAGALWAAVFALAPLYLGWILVKDLALVVRGLGKAPRFYLATLVLCAMTAVGYWAWLERAATVH